MSTRLRYGRPVLLFALGAAVASVLFAYRDGHAGLHRCHPCRKVQIGSPGWSVRAVAFRSEHEVVALAVTPSPPGDGATDHVLYRVLANGVVAGRSVLEHVDVPGCDMAPYCFSSNGLALAHGGVRGCVGVWDCATSRPSWTHFAPESRSPSALAFSPGGQTLIAAQGSRAGIQLYGAASGEGLQQLGLGSAFAVSVAAIPGRGALAAGLPNGSVGLLSLGDGRALGRAPARSEMTRALAGSPDGTMLAAGANDGTIRLLSVPDCTLLAQLDGHTGAITALAFAHVLASAGEDCSVRLWDPRTARPLARLVGHRASVLCVAFSPSGRLMASGDEEGQLLLWDATVAPPIFSGRHAHL